MLELFQTSFQLEEILSHLSANTVLCIQNHICHLNVKQISFKVHLYFHADFWKDNELSH
jgi:hypothetical protein